MTPSERVLLNLIDHPVFVIEPDGQGVPRYASVNGNALSYVGWEESDVLGHTAADLFPGPLGQVAFHHHVEALRDGVQRRYEVLLPAKNGERCLRTTLTPQRDSKGQVFRLIATAIDISSQNSMIHMGVDAEKLAAELEDFVYLAAHDLRTPMRNVVTIAEILREDFVDHGDGKLELIDMLGEIADKTKALIGDILAHAQATALTTEMVHFEFEPLIDQIMRMLDPMGQVRWHAPQVTINGDRAATQIVLRNLIDNALKFAHPTPNSATLVLDFDVVQVGSGMYCISVDDNGVGFSDTDAGGDTTFGGFGLMAVRRLLGRRGGQLTIGNRPDRQGARLSFTLKGTCASNRPDRLYAAG